MNADDLQRQAREILSESRFHERRTPGPFRGVLRQLGEWLEPVLGPIERFLAKIFDVLAAWWAEPVARIGIVIAVIALAVALSTVVVKRRSAASFGGAADDASPPIEDPAALELAATRAEQAGEFAEAVRLRFQAGVLRLQNDGRLRRGRSTPTGAIGRQLRLAEFDRLGQTFDAVAYGSRPASHDDAIAARRDWERVLADSGSRS